MDKFNRRYELSVQTVEGTIITIELPFTIEFDIIRNNLTSANTSSIRIYNLSQRNRNLIRKNSWDVWDIRKVQLKAGYGENLPVVFTGYMSRAWSVRENNNFITQIESYDGGPAFATAVTNQSFPSGTEKKTILETLVASLSPTVSKGVVGSYPGTISRGNTYSGNTVEILQNLSGGGFFIDNNVGNCLNDNEFIEGQILLINSDSGLLGTPVLEETYLTFDIIFEPRLKIGQKVQLDSITEGNFNGFYVVSSAHHRGMISPAVCGNATTTAGFVYSKALVGVQ